VLSLGTTIMIIILILGGITALTKDMTFLSVHLLVPLSEVAEQIMNIVAMGGIAGCAPGADVESEAHKKAEQKEGVVSEVKIVKRTFENMKVALKSWGKYVPWPVVKGMLKSEKKAVLDVREDEITMFFSDIASFTTIVEKLVPKQSLLLLSRYFNDMSKVIDDHDGVLVEFIGDAIQAIYGAPVKQAQHPTKGLQAAVRMMERLKRMNKRFKEWHLPEVSVRCGLHTGKVLVGNMGFESRMKYGIIGEESGIPGKLEEMNKNYSTSILISHSVYERVMADPYVEEQFFIRPVDVLHLRPHLGPTPTAEKVYHVCIPVSPTVSASCPWRL